MELKQYIGRLMIIRLEKTRWSNSLCRDYAIAVLDEIERPQHENERFTVVGEA